MSTDVSESCLAPPPDIIYWQSGSPIHASLSFSNKVTFIAGQYLSFLKDVLSLPFKFCSQSTKISQLADSESLTLPNHFGFADSFFQTTGIGTTYSQAGLRGKCQWQDWM